MRPALPLKGAPMEASHTDAPPRPKGFVRRNWLALVLFCSFFILSVLEFHIPKPNFAAIACFDGNLYVATAGESFEGETASTIMYGWGYPQFGGIPYFWHNEHSAGVQIPIWLPLTCLAAWITFREWRRKRAGAQQ
jgi:hypothetical protein